MGTRRRRLRRRLPGSLAAEPQSRSFLFSFLPCARSSQGTISISAPGTESAFLPRGARPASERRGFGGAGGAGGRERAGAASAYPGGSPAGSPSTGSAWPRRGAALSRKAAGRAGPAAARCAPARRRVLGGPRTRPTSPRRVRRRPQARVASSDLGGAAASALPHPDQPARPGAARARSAPLPPPRAPRVPVPPSLRRFSRSRAPQPKRLYTAGDMRPSVGTRGTPPRGKSRVVGPAPRAAPRWSAASAQEAGERRRDARCPGSNAARRASRRQRERLGTRWDRRELLAPRCDQALGAPKARGALGRRAAPAPRTCLRCSVSAGGANRLLSGKAIEASSGRRIFGGLCRRRNTCSGRANSARGDRPRGRRAPGPEWPRPRERALRPAAPPARRLPAAATAPQKAVVVF